MARSTVLAPAAAPPSSGLQARSRHIAPPPPHRPKRRHGKPAAPPPPTAATGAPPETTPPRTRGATASQRRGRRHRGRRQHCRSFGFIDLFFLLLPTWQRSAFDSSSSFTVAPIWRPSFISSTCGHRTRVGRGRRRDGRSVPRTSGGGAPLTRLRPIRWRRARKRGRDEAVARRPAAAKSAAAR